MGQGGKREARHDVYEPAGPQAVMVWSEKYQRLGKERGEGNSKKKNGWNKFKKRARLGCVETYGERLPVVAYKNNTI